MLRYRGGRSMKDKTKWSTCETLPEKLIKWIKKLLKGEKEKK